MSCRQTIRTLTQLLKEANHSVDTWKERCRILEWDRDGWREKTRELIKILYCSTCQKRYQVVKPSMMGKRLNFVGHVHNDYLVVVDNN